MRENKRQGGGAALKAVGMSDIGKCRKNNEDAYYISAGEDPAENLYLVADGMGGHNAGEIASALASAVQCAQLAMAGVTATRLDGIVAEDVEVSIRNLANLGIVGMNQTDRVILDMMLAK